jgi:phytoene dehydrogenase-like protein
MKDVLLVEASDGVGGRVRTDVTADGFILDRGFQIFLTSYKECREMLDYEALDLKPFYAGAEVFSDDNRFYRVADPVRHLFDALLSLLPTNKVGTVVDKINVGIFRIKSLLGSEEELLSRPETTIMARLKEEGFSASMINSFFRPFLGGIFFDRSLSTSSRLFEFVMRSLAMGQNCLPSRGIGSISDQLASMLPSQSILLNTKVTSIESSPSSSPKVILSDGSVLTGRKGVILATPGPEAERLLGSLNASQPSKSEQGVGTSCLYFRSSAPPPNNGAPMLYLNGQDEGIVNNCCWPSTVSSSYAPPGQNLISVSTVGSRKGLLSDQELESQVKKQLASWFGQDQVKAWSLIRIYHIPYAQPNQSPPTNFDRPGRIQGVQGLYVAGDHRTSATFDGAIKSGRKAAEALLKGS